jgi:hypothetical protein
MKCCRRMFYHQMSRTWTVCKIQYQRPSYKWSSGGTQRDKLHEGQGGLQGLHPLRSDGSEASQAGRLDRWALTRGESRGAIRLESTQIRWFLWWSGREAWTKCAVDKRLQWNNLSSRGDIRLEPTQIRWFSWWPGREGTRWPVANDAQGKADK